ncbi:MAG TPA: glycosyltransferase [Bacillota bacterium]|nr:glycosyltransferase [Bacillota bacterium]
MAKKQRVVHMTTVHHPTDPRIYHKQCKSLAKAGFQVYYIAKDDESLEDIENIQHIPVKQYGNRISRMIFGSISAYRKAKKLKADIYHFHDPELMIVGALLKNKHNTVIYDVHEDYVTSILQKDYLPKFLRHIFAKVYTWMEKLFITKMELSLAEKYYYNLYKRGELILNYPLLNENFLTKNRKKEKIEPKLLYTGNVTEDRGALFHAEIPAIHNEVSVHFIGKCPKELSEKMYNQAKGHEERIHIEGIDRFVEKEDIDRKYEEREWLAGIALFPPTDHYMQKELTKFFEYMNAGLPIICSNFPVWQEFIETYECGIAVDPYDHVAIKQAITYLLEHPDKAKQMGEKGRQAVMNELNWQEEAKKLISWYDKILKNRTVSH